MTGYLTDLPRLFHKFLRIGSFIVKPDTGSCLIFFAELIKQSYKVYSTWDQLSGAFSVLITFVIP